MKYIKAFLVVDLLLMGVGTALTSYLAEGLALTIAATVVSVGALASAVHVHKARI